MTDIFEKVKDQVNIADAVETFGVKLNSRDKGHRLTDRLTECRVNGVIAGLLPDGKSQVSVEYDGDRFSRIVSIVVSAQHREDKPLDELTTEIKEKVIAPVFAEYDISKTEILVNPSGRFVIGGFVADTGLTGRKLMVDTYGGIAHNGGGALSGKDASIRDSLGTRSS